MKNYEPIIPKKDLIDGAYYRGSCRNATEARWYGIQEVFYHWRTKFGYRFVESISCPEDDLYYDVFVAEERIETPTEEIPLELPPVE